MRWDGMKTNARSGCCCSTWWLHHCVGLVRAPQLACHIKNDTKLSAFWCIINFCMLCVDRCLPGLCSGISGIWHWNWERQKWHTICCLPKLVVSSAYIQCTMFQSRAQTKPNQTKPFDTCALGSDGMGQQSEIAGKSTNCYHLRVRFFIRVRIRCY